MILPLQALLGALLIAGCGDDTDDTATTDSGTTDSGTTDSGTTEDVLPIWSLSGTALDFATLDGALTAGLCLSVTDPELALVTGSQDDIVVLGSAIIDENGAWSVDGIQTATQVGLMLLVTDCDESGTTMPTATGFQYSFYADVEDGDALTDATALVISMTMISMAVDPSLGALGITESVVDTGMMAGFVRDALGAPVEGAVVTSEDAASIFYLDANPADGLFTTAGAPNAATLAGAGAGFVVPAAPITTYSCAADGYTFDNVLFGTLPGLATVMGFEPAAE